MHVLHYLGKIRVPFNHLCALMLFLNDDNQHCFSYFPSKFDTCMQLQNLLHVIQIYIYNTKS